ITRSGQPDAYITYKAYPGHTPKLQLQTGLNFQIWRAVAIDASYIVFTGIEIENTNQQLDYAGAYQTYTDYKNNIKDYNKISMYNCGSISIGGGAPAHHVIVTNCKIHDTGGGLGATKCDYITIENNLIYNTCWYSMYAGSGISILDPTSIDAVTTYKMFVRNNVVNNNKTFIPWEQISALSDGNGIILDVNIGNGSTTAAYVGRYLVENNVSYNNGGGGVHAYKAAHADIINNTAYNNGTVVGYPEIDANQCSDVKIYNNIMYARTGGNCNGNDANTIYDYNLYFNGPSFKNGPHDKTANPQFVLLATDATANLQLKNTSPAINNGSNVPGQYSPADILGVARPVGFSSDMGAYEYATVISRPKIKITQGAAEMFRGTAYDFGDVSSTDPKTVTFTINNIGDLQLDLTGTPRVIVTNTTGTGFSLAADAPAVVAVNGSVSFNVTLSPQSTPANYAGTLYIANNDADQNPFSFLITGYGYDGNKALQTITFPALPTKVIGNADFNPGATSSAGLPITYTSSNTGVATIVAGQIHIVAAGTSTITATQPGDASTNPTRSVTQLLTVTPVLPQPGENMVTNPTFDVNTNGWSFANKNGGVSTIASVPMTGSNTNVGKVTITTLPSPPSSDNIQLSTNVFLVKDRNYLISFKANADAARSIGLRILQNASPYSTIFSPNVNITTTQTTYGTYAYPSTYTGSVALRFFLGNSSIPVYFDDVIMIEEASITLPVSLVSFTGTLTGDKALLNWKTATELNVNGCNIEKSTDAVSFAAIGYVPARNISSGSTYSFSDVESIKGQVYYRLKTIDRDGSFTHSKIVTIMAEVSELTGVKIFPNPVTTYCAISYPVASVNAKLSIITTDGKKIGDYNIAAGSTQRSIDVSALPAGHYFIVYKNDSQITSSTFIK
ncbi:MAG: choice-of-anchor Q domain-containing protein, partial [Segetibacter sp.]